ncbi:exonuclease domain-containing protein [Puniceibacterium confluentis]|uniref:exonuclease domain-containing protein n=1 Tax=Puniceibacterium confluentis TaxID=1958944 RepID=UPI0011B71F80|nr:exonuclease domain-containing protein [Puniceibacterium confluentis]
MNRFSVIDVETANADYSSICQVGIVNFENGAIISSKNYLIDPQSYFDPFNVGIHGINQKDVAGKMNFKEAYQEISASLREKIVVHHGHFDFTAFNRCYDKHFLPPIKCDWLDNTKIVRRTWSEFSRKGYSLKSLANHFGIELDHHDAVSDAKAAGLIFCKALTESGTLAADWLELVKMPITGQNLRSDVKREGDPNAPFYGETIVFTGSLVIARQTAADVEQQLGFDVRPGVTKNTSYICAGIQNLDSLIGYAKSSKQRKAESLRNAGQEISFLSEDDFWELAKIHLAGEAE